MLSEQEEAVKNFSPSSPSWYLAFVASGLIFPSILLSSAVAGKEASRPAVLLYDSQWVSNSEIPGESEICSSTKKRELADLHSGFAHCSAEAFP